MTGSGIDPTPLPGDDDALTESREQFRLFMQHLPGVTFIKDAAGRYRYINDGVARARGWKREDAIGRTDAELFPPDVAARLQAADEAVLSTGQALQVIEETGGRGGEVRWLLTKFPIPRGDGFWLGGIGVDITDRVRAEAERDDARRNLEQLSRRLASAQEEERRRLARELHDEVGQLATGLKLALEAEPGSGPATAQALQLAQELIAAVRSLSQSLRPPLLDAVRLHAALESHVDRYQAQMHVEVNLGLSGSDEHLEPVVETAAYRIVQEALTNVARHAGSKRALVRVDVGERELTLRVEDEGRGFDPGTPPAGDAAGLRGMHERATALGGTLDVDSVPGRGTRIVARLPLRAGGAT